MGVEIGRAKKHDGKSWNVLYNAEKLSNFFMIILQLYLKLNMKHSMGKDSKTLNKCFKDYQKHLHK